MTRTKDVIEAAIRGGYEQWWMGDIHHDSLGINYGVLTQIVLQPSFWQALGKELGWDGPGIKDGYMMRWEIKMDRLMSHLRNGGDIEEYLIELIK